MFDGQGRRKYLNNAERRAYLKAIRNETDKTRRAFCLTLFYTGCRISEALNLTVKSIDLSQRAIVFETLKRRRRGIFREVPVPDSLIRILTDITDRSAPSTHLWKLSRSTAYRMVKAMMIQATISGGMASPKGLRHGFGVACTSKKIPLPTIKKWLGHARLETTAIYLDVIGAEERNLASRLWRGR